MVKPREDVVREFNELVNMSAHELSTWLENPESTRAGTGVGLQSGRRIIDILTRNPSQDPDKFADEDIPHMGKVVGYIKRHRAREDHLKRTKTPEELEHTKSTISLRNWGYDPMKTLGDSSSVKYKAEEASEDEDDFASADENEREERGTGPDESEDRAKTQTRQPKPPSSRKNATEQKTEED